MYNGLTTADKPALLDAQAKGAEWVAIHWGGKAYGYAEKPNQEDVFDECCYGSYSSWTAQDGDVEIELGFMPYPLLSYQDKEPFHIPTALAQIEEMERDFSAVFPDEPIGGMEREQIIGTDRASIEMDDMYDQIHAKEQKPDGCDFCNGKREEHGFFIDGNVLYYREGQLGTEGIVINACPMCLKNLKAEDGK